MSSSSQQAAGSGNSPPESTSKENTPTQGDREATPTDKEQRTAKAKKQLIKDYNYLLDYMMYQGDEHIEIVQAYEQSFRNNSLGIEDKDKTLEEWEPDILRLFADHINRELDYDDGPGIEDRLSIPQDL